MNGSLHLSNNGPDGGGLTPPAPAATAQSLCGFGSLPAKRAEYNKMHADAGTALEEANNSAGGRQHKPEEQKAELLPDADPDPEMARSSGGGAGGPLAAPPGIAGDRDTVADPASPGAAIVERSSVPGPAMEHAVGNLGQRPRRDAISELAAIWEYERSARASRIARERRCRHVHLHEHEHTSNFCVRCDDMCDTTCRECDLWVCFRCSDRDPLHRDERAPHR